MTLELLAEGWVPVFKVLARAAAGRGHRVTLWIAG